MITPYRFIGQIPEQTTQAAASVAASVVAGTTSAATAALAIPVIGGVAAAALIVMGWIRRRNAQKVAATNVVNEAEPFLVKNRDAFLASVAAGTAGEQERARALATFDAIWGQVMQECQAIGGGGGERCVTDRQSGACVWQDLGQCWNWFVGYRDPIANAVIVGGGQPGPSWLPGLQDLGMPSGWTPLVGAVLIAGALALSGGRS